jgi:exopolyphosphatase/guanosine-5'-triphosphate,3'-diphosphate pyrophosphatase
MSRNELAPETEARSDDRVEETSALEMPGSQPSMRPFSDSTFASIDIGSHTIRMIIARLEESGRIRPLRFERRITRLARDFGGGGVLQTDRMSESIAALHEYAEILESHHVGAVACGATGVVRRARNNQDFLESVFERTGLRVSILSETSEAVLSARGILSVLAKPEGTILLFDLGGGSTEFLLVDTSRPEPVWSTSVFIGAATVTEKYLTGDPPLPSSVSRAAAAIEDELKAPLSTVEGLLRSSSPVTVPVPEPYPLLVVGTAGTVTTLAAMYLEMTRYEPFRVNGLVLPESWLNEAVDHLARSSLASRREIPGLEPGREDIILGGALIVREILRSTCQDRLTVTDAGLLEGILLDLIENARGWPHPLASSLTWEM